MNVELDKFENSWYNPGKGKVIQVLWYTTNALFFNSWLLPSSSVKVRLLRCFGAKVGSGVIIKPKVNIKYPWKLSISNNSWIGENVWIDNLAEVAIGSNCCISQGAMLLCGNHNYKKVEFDLMVNNITLEDGVWVGAKTVVCPGVTLYRNSILTVGSIASSDLKENSIYRGNPAILVKEREII